MTVLLLTLKNKALFVKARLTNSNFWTKGLAWIPNHVG